jgi:hypothetical protein
MCHTSCSLARLCLSIRIGEMGFSLSWDRLDRPQGGDRRVRDLQARHSAFAGCRMSPPPFLPYCVHLASMLSMDDALVLRVTGCRFPHYRCSAHSFLDCINIGRFESTNRDATLLPFFPFLLSTPIFQSLQPYKVSGFA